MNTFQKILKKYSSYLQAKKQEQIYHKQLKVLDTTFINGLEQYQINGNKVFVASSQEKSFQSVLQNLAILEQLKPRCVLLDAVSNRVLKQWIQDNSIETAEQSLLGKKKFASLFIDIFPNQNEYFTINDNNTYVYLLRERKIQFKDQLSVAYYACNDPKMHIMIAKPDEILQIEDIVTNFSLEELKNVFMHTIEEIKQVVLDPEMDSSSSFSEIQFLFKSLVMKNHTYLYENYIDYQAALLQKSSRIQEKSCLFTQQFFLQQVVKASQEKLFDHNDFYINENIQFQNKNELLEKIVIAGFIIDYVLRIQAMQGQNPFLNTKFKNYLTQDDVPQFLKLHQFYSDQLYNLQNFIIQTTLYKQPEQGRYFTFENTLKKFKKEAAGYKYELNVSYLTKIQQSLMLQDLFQKQVKQIIQTRMMQGVNQKEILQAMQNIGEDNYTRKDLKNYLKIVMEANAALGYPIKFPGNLKEIMLPFIHNLQVEKTAEVASGLVFQPLSKRLSVAKLPEKQTNPNEFTDDEDEDDKDDEIRYVLSVDGQNKQVPPDLKDMSMEEIQEIADEFKQFKFQVNENGEYEILDEQDTQQFKQEDVDKFFAQVDIDDREQSTTKINIENSEESRGRRIKKKKQ